MFGSVSTKYFQSLLSDYDKFSSRAQRSFSYPKQSPSDSNVPNLSMTAVYIFPSYRPAGAIERCQMTEDVHDL
jgi:hypothetical protein